MNVQRRRENEVNEPRREDTSYSMSGISFHDSDDDESLGMDTCVFSDYKENDGRFILPFTYAPLASVSSSDGSCSDTRDDPDGSDSSDKDSARLRNTDW